jgi:predicted DNA-binding transcriptional regulator AlpA
VSIASTGLSDQERRGLRLRRFIDLATVKALTGLSTSTIYSRMASGDFPKQVVLFDNGHDLKNIARWDADEMSQWQEARIAARDQKFNIAGSQVKAGQGQVARNSRRTRKPKPSIDEGTKR